MTKFGTDPRLWPASAGPRKRGLSSLKPTVHTWVGLVVVLIAGLSLADQMAWPSADSAVHAPPLAPDAVATPGVCWHDWPYIRTGCDDNPVTAATPAAATTMAATTTAATTKAATSTAAATPHTRQVRDVAVSTSAPAIGAPIVAATSFAPRPGTGTPPVATTDGAGSPAPSASPVPPRAAHPDRGGAEPTARTGTDLQTRLCAAAGGTGAFSADVAASPAPAAPAKLAQAKPKPRKVRTASQVYDCRTAGAWSFIAAMATPRPMRGRAGEAMPRPGRSASPSASVSRWAGVRAGLTPAATAGFIRARA